LNLRNDPTDGLIGNVRIWGLSTGMALLSSMAVLTLALSADPPPVAYECLDGSRFTLLASTSEAVVRFSDREYRLPRRPSSLAIKYESKAATLFLDGEFAAFIAEDRPLPGCYRLSARKRD
jgi:hypothetical protein